jgi:hypothetical protein
MAIRTLATVLVAAAAAFAQPPGRGGADNWGPRLVGAEPGRQGPVVKGAPFSADLVTETTQALADGNHIHLTSTSRLYRDAEGRTRREQSLNGLGALAPNANLPPVVFINDPVARVNYALSPAAHTAMRSAGGRGLSWNGTAGEPARKQDAAAGSGRRMRGAQAQASGQNQKTESLGRQTIEGVQTEGTRTTVTIAAGQMGNEQPMQIVTETWYSADLQMTVFSRRSDPRSGETVTRYTNISRTEPAHALFEVPADYKVTDAGGRGQRPAAK